MSVIIELEDFSKETQLKIDKMLTFTPVQQKKFNQTFSFEPSETPVKCYYTANKKVHLPYRFACCLMNKIFNMETYPPLSVNKDLIFKYMIRILYYIFL